MRRNKFRRQVLGLFAAVLGLTIVGYSSSFGQGNSQVPAEYRKYFVKSQDSRSGFERALNLVGMTGQDVGRSYALIAGVSYYPNMPALDQRLSAAAEDMRKLQQYLDQYEFFDEIVVLENEHVTTENFEYFLQTYFPGQLKKSPKSRFLFAYSGHGINKGNSSYLLKNTARSITDQTNSINLSVLRVYVDEVVNSGHHVLVLLNACYSGAFTGRRAFGGPKPMFVPRDPGAHAITAGGSQELAWANSDIGPGSIFFEKVFAGLNGRADDSDDGVVTVYELASYLRREVQFSTGQNQNPQFGDISLHGSTGEFFFLNRNRQVSQGALPEWNPNSGVAFGRPRALERAMEYYNAGEMSSAIEAFTEAANSGNGEAMAYLGFIFEQGFGVAIDYDKSFYWTEKAAKAGDPWGMGGLGVMYRDGLGTPRDYAQARNWFQRGADAGNARAKVNLGAIYENAQGVPQNYPESSKWYLAGAESGDSLGMVYIGTNHLHGHGVPQSDATALDWYRRGAAAGEASGMNLVGWMHEYGRGTDKDAMEAARWYQKAAEAGHAEGMGNLGYLYRSGTGIERNYSEALYWLRKGHQGGDRFSTGQIGYMYMNGLGVTQDYVEAKKWLDQGANANDTRSMENLGKIYEEGLGTSVNHAEAIKWYRKAAEKDSVFAKKRLDALGAT